MAQHGLYQPKIADEHIRQLYQWAKRLQMPMTRLVNALLAHALTRLEQGVVNVEIFIYRDMLLCMRYGYGVLQSLRQHVYFLIGDHRTHILLPGRSRYGSWTQNLSDDPPHAWPTPDTPGVATRDHDCGRACPPGADYLTPC
jgi:hypothetical protein